MTSVVEADEQGKKYRREWALQQCCLSPREHLESDPRSIAGRRRPPPRTRFSSAAPRSTAVFDEVVTYQPGSRYWDFQWLELGIYVGGALVLAGLCVWWARRRLT